MSHYEININIINNIMVLYLKFGILLTDDNNGILQSKHSRYVIKVTIWIAKVGITMTGKGKSLPLEHDRHGWLIVNIKHWNNIPFHTKNIKLSVILKIRIYTHIYVHSAYIHIHPYIRISGSTVTYKGFIYRKWETNQQ